MRMVDALALTEDEYQAMKGPVHLTKVNLVHEAKYCWYLHTAYCII